MEQIALNFMMIITSVLLGWVVCWEVCKLRCQHYYIEAQLIADLLEETEELLKTVCDAATPVVAAISRVGDSKDWSDAAETFRRYEWHEISPLAKALKEVEEAYDGEL